MDQSAPTDDEDAEEVERVTADDLCQAQINVYNTFCELSATRSWIESNPLRINYTEVHAWASLNRLMLQPWELEALRRLDVIWIAAHAKVQQQQATS